MCTLILLHRVDPDYPLLIAANRDERFDRPAACAALRRLAGGQRVFAPRDLRAGGTWLGVNAAGLFVGVTNRFGAPFDPERRSRGRLVVDALRFTHAEDALEHALALGPSAHNGYHLVVADREAAWCVINAVSLLGVRRLEPGVHVVTERSARGDDPRGQHVRAWIGTEARATDGVSVAQLRRCLCTHGNGSAAQAVCVHVPEARYGTRSSALIGYGAEAPPFWLEAQGAPCGSAFEDRSHAFACVFA